MNRYLWVWSTDKIIENPIQTLNECKETSINNLILYTPPTLWQEPTQKLRAFIAKSSENGIRVWGMDGYRGYLEDTDGPSELYAAVDGLIAYNANVQENEKFVGFSTDVEPADQAGNENLLQTFHNGVPQSKLDKESKGNWKESQYLDRQCLMQSWLGIHKELKDKLHQYNLLLSVALPTWLDDYCGEPITTFYNNCDICVVEHFFDLSDEIIFMSYNTNPHNVIHRLQGKLKLAPTNGLKIMAAMETIKGVDEYVSYADTPNKNNRNALLHDLAVIEKELQQYPAFGGIAIHDYNGLTELK